jgi:hypothetical protein
MWKCCAPNPAKKCMQLLGEHHCITFQLRMQRKDESFNACRFRAPAKCTPTVSQNFHSGGGVMWKCCAPNPAKKCMQLLGEHHCITFQLRMQRKDESFNACRFRAPAKCTPTVSQNFHSGGGCDVEVLRPQSCKEMHATAWRASLHHISTSYAKKR